MNRKSLQISVTLTILLIGKWAFAAGTIVHQPVMDYDLKEPLVLFATVSTDQDPLDVRILYRSEGDYGYIEVLMVQYGEMWRGEIPQSDLIAEEIQYFIASTLTDGSVITFPVDDPENSPLRIKILSPAPPPPPPVETADAVDTETTSEYSITAADGEVLIFSPLPGATVPFDDIYIAASLFNISSPDVSSIYIYVDGKDVTKSSEISKDIVTYSPYEMAAGKHSVRIELKTEQGASVPAKTWSFNVIKKSVEEIEREFTYRGRWNSGYSLDRIEGEELAVGKTAFSLTGEWRWVKTKADMKITSDEDPLKQPKNRFKFSLNLGKYFSLNLGDSNSRISKFTLDGKRIRGVDANLKFGWVNLHLVKGELDRTIQGPLTTDNSLFIDAISVKQNEEDSTKFDIKYQLDRKGYSFQKDIFAGRLSFGSGKVFQWGLNWLKAKDNINSVESILGDAKISVQDTISGTVDLAVPAGTYTYDALQELIRAEEGYGLSMSEKRWGGNTPQDNIVVGSDMRLSMFKRKINVEAGFAISMLNKDIWNGAISKIDLDTLMDDTLDGWIGQTYDENNNIETKGFVEIKDIPVDPSDYEDFFIINANMVPLIPIDPDSTQLANDPLSAIKNMPSLAYNLKTSAKFFNNNIIFEYIKVGPEFNSLGNPYIQKNYKEYSIQDRVRLFKNRLFLNVLYKHLDNDVLRNVPIVSTAKTMAVNANVFPGPNLPSFTIGYRTLDRDNGKTMMDTLSVAIDTVTEQTNIWLEDYRDNTRTKNTTFGIKYQINFFNMENNIAVNLISVQKTDEVNNRAGFPYYDVSNSTDTTFFDSSFSSPDLRSDVMTISLITQFPIPLKTTTVISVNKSEFGRDAMYGTQDITSVNVNAVYNLIKGKLKLLGGVNYTSGTGNDKFQRIGIRGGVNYRITDYLGLRVDGELRSKSVDGETKSTTLARASLNYTF